MKRRVFDETFRQMAIDLSYAKGSVREAAEELGIDSGRISKWRQRDNKPAQSGKSHTDLTDEQKQIRQLQKQLKEAQLERDILKSVDSAGPVVWPRQLESHL
jgi:transposase